MQGTRSEAKAHPRQAAVSRVPQIYIRTWCLKKTMHCNAALPFLHPIMICKRHSEAYIIFNWIWSQMVFAAERRHCRLYANYTTRLCIHTAYIHDYNWSRYSTQNITLFPTTQIHTHTHLNMIRSRFGQLGGIAGANWPIGLYLC